MRGWTWRLPRGVCSCGGSDVAQVGQIHHAPWCPEVGGDGIKPRRALPVLAVEEAARLRRLRTVRP